MIRKVSKVIIKFVKFKVVKYGIKILILLVL